MWSPATQGMPTHHTHREQQLPCALIAAVWRPCCGCGPLAVGLMCTTAGYRSVS